VQAFVVRLWTPADAGEPFSLHGTVEHVGSGRSRAFRGPEELLAALQAGLELPPPISAPAAKGRSSSPAQDGRS
jgi:hypothetical protein